MTYEAISKSNTFFSVKQFLNSPIGVMFDTFNRLVQTFLGESKGFFPPSESKVDNIEILHKYYNHSIFPFY